MSLETGPTLEELRHAFQGGATAGTEGCPPPATIWEAVHGELPPDRLREVVEHTARCAACALEWRLARELSPVRPANDAPQPAVSLPARRSPAWPRVAALAAGLLLVLSLPLLWRPDEKPVVRGTGTSAIAFELRTRELPRAHPELVFELPPGATFDLAVTTADGATLVHRDEGWTEPSYLLPAGKLAGLRPGTRLNCQVKVSLPDGRSDSKSFEVVLR